MYAEHWIYITILTFQLLKISKLRNYVYISRVFD